MTILLTLFLVVFWVGVLSLIGAITGLISFSPLVVLAAWFVALGIIITILVLMIKNQDMDEEVLSPEEAAERELRKKFVHHDPEIFEALRRAEANLNKEPDEVYDAGSQVE